ncbi:MAG: hypothetical protein ACKO1U_04510, partial [Bacteroidota bacterium]
RTRQRQLITWKKALMAFSLTATIGGGATWMMLQFGQSDEATAASLAKENIEKGSMMIRWEDAVKHPETIGLLQDLIQTSLVPVEWIKSEGANNTMGIDGFIVRRDYLSPLVQSKFEQWSSTGLKITRLEKDITCTKTHTLTWFPTWKMDSTSEQRNQWMKVMASTGLPPYTVIWSNSADSTKWEFHPCAQWADATKATTAGLLNAFLKQSMQAPWSGKIIGADAMTAGMKSSLKVDPTWAVSGWTFQWTSSIGGTFDRPMSLATSYLAPVHYQNDTIDIIRIRATSPEGWTSFAAWPVKITHVTSGPVAVSSFTIHPNKGGILLKWSTASETDNDFFSVERSEDGVSWKPIGHQPGAGNSQSINHYHFTDNQPFQGRSYYRLGQTSFNGNKSYYQILSIDNYDEVDASNVLRVEDAVFESSLSFRIESVLPGEGQLRIYSPNGELKASKNYPLVKGKQVLFYDQDGLDGGVYIAVFQDSEGKVSSTRIVKI